MTQGRHRLRFSDGELIPLGGSGENGRNCFLVAFSGRYVLLDCGVRRDATASPQKAYPSLDQKLVSRLDAVFLSHAHEDHCAALPLLYRLGYRGVIYASIETLSLAPEMIQKWMNYIKDQKGILPYDEEDARLLRFSQLEPGISNINGIKVLAGRSGHTVGSLWFALGQEDAADWQLFYSGDMCLSSPLLAHDLPPPCQAAVIDSANADQTIDIQAQYIRLEGMIQDTWNNQGHLLMPVPASGRGSDLLLYCAQGFSHIPLWAEEKIHQRCLELLSQANWLRKDIPSAQVLASVHVVRTDAQREAAANQPAGIYLATDGMLTGKASQYYISRFSENARDTVLITGHAATGTPAQKLLEEEYRRSNKIRMNVSRLVIKVHLDTTDVLWLCDVLKTRNVMPFHAREETCAKLREQIAALPAIRA